MNCANTGCCSEGGDIALSPKTIGTTDRIEIELEKNGEDWTGADTVTGTLVSPEGVEKEITFTILSGNVWYYDLISTDIDETGYWGLLVYVTDEGITSKYPSNIEFRVDS